MSFAKSIYKVPGKKAAVTYSEPNRTSQMELFAEVVELLAVNHFRKKLHLRYLTEF